MSPQDPPQQPEQGRPQLRAVPKRRGRRPKLDQTPPPLIPPIPDPDGTHARVSSDPDPDRIGLVVTWVPATVKAGYRVGYRYGSGQDGERVILGTYELATTVTLPDGIKHVIPAQFLMLDLVALDTDIDGALASATYEHDLDLTYPDGTPLLGQAHHDHVAAYRRRHPEDHRSRD